MLSFLLFVALLSMVCLIIRRLYIIHNGELIEATIIGFDIDHHIRTDFTSAEIIYYEFAEEQYTKTSSYYAAFQNSEIGDTIEIYSLRSNPQTVVKKNGNRLYTLFVIFFIAWLATILFG